jgi:Amt family ammonium transporter
LCAINACAIGWIIGAQGKNSSIAYAWIAVLPAGYPQGETYPAINLGGQLLGAFLCTIVLGFIPGYVCSLILKQLGLLRVSREEEMAGLDLSDLGMIGYPEYATVSFVAEQAKQSSGEMSGSGNLATELE